MQTLKFKADPEEAIPDFALRDIALLRDSLGAAGYRASDHDIFKAWQRHCQDSLCISWLSISDEAQQQKAHVQTLMGYMEPCGYEL